MARLTASYSSAMGTVGALHRLSRDVYTESLSEANGDHLPNSDGEKSTVEAAANEDKGNASKEQIETPEEMQIDHDTSNGKDKSTKLEEAQASIQKVAQCARTSLEQSLLLDPTIIAPILLPCTSPPKNNKAANAVLEILPEKMTSAWHTVWNGDTKHKHSSLAKWKKLSAAHKTTVKQISYLSLVNYAGLLLCGCSCPSCGGDILDGRPVPSLEALTLFQAVGDTATDRNEHGTSCLAKTC